MKSCVRPRPNCNLTRELDAVTRAMNYWDMACGEPAEVSLKNTANLMGQIPPISAKCSRKSSK